MRLPFKEHWTKLFVLEDTPQSIALGAAIGIFLGFTPLIGLKTLLALGFAFLFRANKIAAVVAVSLHDLALPLMPVLYRLEYDIGYWLLSEPHPLPPSFNHHQLSGHAWLNWTTFVTLGVPLLLGGVILATPASVLVFFLTRMAVQARRAKVSSSSL